MITDLGSGALSRIAPKELAAQLGLVKRGEPSRRGLAQLLRLAARRWQAVRRRDLLHYGETQLTACGLKGSFEGGVATVVDELVALRDLERANEGGRELLVASDLRVVTVTDNLGLLIGSMEEPPNLRPAWSEDQAARWIELDSETKRAIAEAGGREWSLRDWLQLPRSEESDEVSIVERWEKSAAAIMERAAPITDAAAWSVLIGEPGTYYGSYKDAKGRWARGDLPLPDGLWIAASPTGLHENRWDPALLEALDGVPVRAAYISSWNEASFLSRARGVALGAREVLRVRGGVLEQTCPLPRQLTTPLTAAFKRDGWRYNGPQPATRVIAELLSEHLWLRRELK